MVQVQVNRLIVIILWQFDIVMLCLVSVTWQAENAGN